MGSRSMAGLEIEDPKLACATAEGKGSQTVCALNAGGESARVGLESGLRVHGKGGLSADARAKRAVAFRYFAGAFGPKTRFRGRASKYNYIPHLYLVGDICCRFVSVGPAPHI